MKARTYLIFTHDEVNEIIPYGMIAEIRWGRTWETGKRRRRWLEEFTPAEREAASQLFRQAYNWYLKTGVPDEVKMSTRTFCLWIKLAEFCASL